ncbi:MAG TPA: hypothetical protein VFT96_03135 [Gemmatimonadaceae bacterium]|nr:hypothetical protein [Gemmatimonadaceae bacterium]
MNTRVMHWIRAATVTGAWVGSLAGSLGAQTLAGSSGGEAPTAAILGNDEGEADAIRITHTADGQLLVRVIGAQSAMLLLDDARGRAFAAAVRTYVEKVETEKGCSEADDAIPRLTAPRAHRSGIDGIAIRCVAAPGGGAPAFTVLVTRASREDGPPLQALTVQADAGDVRGFARNLERIMVARRR